LAINNDANHLHGGLVGFDRILWDAEAVEEDGKVGVKISYLSPDMEENYPGNLKVSCIYTLDNDNNLKLEYFAETDKTTVVNLTNHSYFNLTGGKEKIFNHKLHLLATKMTEMEGQIPTGKIVEVAGTPFDFTTPKLIGQDIVSLKIGYDDNYVLDNKNGELKYIACVTEETTSRKIEVLTTQPGVQFYTGYFMNLKKYPQFTGFALETQHYPDSVNKPAFPTTLLKPGEKYHEVTIYRFS
jgi:aldose 1-epimerase